MALHYRCHNHEAREAVSRCPSCRRYYCRECVTEHAGRVICAGCLKAQAAAAGRRRRPLRAFLTALLPVAGFLLAWGWFYLLGRGLSSIPAELHDAIEQEAK